MTALAWLVPIALGLGAAGLAAFLWSLKSGQFEDLEGAGWRALDDDRDTLTPPKPTIATEQPVTRPSPP
ncbi:MAG: cbb3-type cytochrome oxidase assembly protein CcoS [Hyphomicrobiaceae bacterium]